MVLISQKTKDIGQKAKDIEVRVTRLRIGEPLITVTADLDQAARLLCLMQIPVESGGDF